MTLAAAVVPYGAGYSAVLVASGDALPLTYVHAESFEVGRLVQLEEAVGSKTMKRELDDVALATLCQQIHAALRGAQLALIVMSEAAIARRVVAALSVFLPTCGVEVQLVGHAAGFVTNAFHGWNPPEQGRLGFERCAGALIAAKGGWKRDERRTTSDHRSNEDSSSPRGDRSGGERERAGADAASGSVQSAPGTGGQISTRDSERRRERPDCPSLESVAGRSQGGDDKGRDRRVEPTAPDGPVTAALDPGSSYLGVAIVQCDDASAALHLLLGQTFDVGETVIEGSKSRHVLNDASLDALADRVAALLVEFQVTHVYIEHVDSVHIAPTQLSAASSIGTALIRTMMVGTTLRERLRIAGIATTRVRATTWRARIGTRGSRGESEAVALPDVLQAQIVNWQDWAGDVDEHGRDACGLAIYGTLPKSDTRPSSNMARKSGKVDTEQEKFDRLARGVANKRLLRQRKREAKGCHCVITNEDRQHKTGCPIRAERSAKMAMPRGRYKKTRERESQA